MAAPVASTTAPSVATAAARRPAPTDEAEEADAAPPVATASITRGSKSATWGPIAGPATRANSPAVVSRAGRAPPAAAAEEAAAAATAAAAAVAASVGVRGERPPAAVAAATLAAAGGRRRHRGRRRHARHQRAHDGARVGAHEAGAGAGQAAQQDGCLLAAARVGGGVKIRQQLHQVPPQTGQHGGRVDGGEAPRQGEGVGAHGGGFVVERDGEGDERVALGEGGVKFAC